MGENKYWKEGNKGFWGSFVHNSRRTVGDGTYCLILVCHLSKINKNDDAFNGFY